MSEPNDGSLPKPWILEHIQKTTLDEHSQRNIDREENQKHREHIEEMNSIFDGFQEFFSREPPVLSRNELQRCANQFKTLNGFLYIHGYTEFIERDLESLKKSLAQGNTSAKNRAFIWMMTLILESNDHIEFGPIIKLIEDGLEILSPHWFYECAIDLKSLMPIWIERQKRDTPSSANEDLMTLDEIVSLTTKSKTMIRPLLGDPAILGGGRGRKSYWHYIQARDQIQKEYSDQNLPILFDALAKIGRPSSKKNFGIYS